MRLILPICCHYLAASVWFGSVSKHHQNVLLFNTQPFSAQSERRSEDWLDGRDVSWNMILCSFGSWLLTKHPFTMQCNAMQNKAFRLCDLSKIHSFFSQMKFNGNKKLQHWRYFLKLFRWLLIFHKKLWCHDNKNIFLIRTKINNFSLLPR